MRFFQKFVAYVFDDHKGQQDIILKKKANFDKRLQYRSKDHDEFCSELEIINKKIANNVNNIILSEVFI